MLMPAPRTLSLLLAAVAFVLPCLAMAADDDVVALLKRGRYRELDTQLMAYQKQYEAGKLSEVELRLKPRPLSGLKADDLPRFDAWVSASPKSYFAVLMRGTLLKELAVSARGDGPASTLSNATRREMRRLFDLAERDLLASLALASTPVLTYLHLLHVSGMQCQNDKRARYLAQWEQHKRAGTIVRLRYLWYSTPRWCGSHEEMEEFIRAARKHGAPEHEVKQFVAFLEDDRGDVALRQKQYEKGLAHLRRALDLAKEIGGDFVDEWLPISDFHRCSWEPLRGYCNR